MCGIWPARRTRISGLLPLLLREGAKASHVTRVVAEVNDRVTAKILQFAEAKLGPPPVPYCWVVLGSEGRREQTFKTDQDNALIYSDAGDEPAAREYFTQLAAFAQDALGSLWLSALHGQLHGEQSALAAAASNLAELLSPVHHGSGPSWHRGCADSV